MAIVARRLSGSKWEQFRKYVTQTLKFDFGRSFDTTRPVIDTAQLLGIPTVVVNCFDPDESRFIALFSKYCAAASAAGIDSTQMSWTPIGQGGTVAMYRALVAGKIDAALPDQEIMKRWWAHMRDIMATDADNVPVQIPLKRVFYLK